MPRDLLLTPLVAALLSAIVLIAAVFDIRTRRIPNWLTGLGIAIGFGVNMYERGAFGGMVFSLSGLAVAATVYLLLYVLRALGGGDAKLMMAVGAFAGWQNWIGIFIVAALAGGIAAIILAAAKGRLRQTLWNTGFILSEAKQGRPAHHKRKELDVRSGQGMSLPHGAVIAVSTLLYLALQSRLV